MSQFFEEIWDSVFTPGTNSSLLLATNASFAALQLVLFLLLVATYSIHFVILSVLSAGLWWAINWFARELKAAQLLEDAKQKKEDKGEKEEEDDDDDDDGDDEAGEKKKRSARGGRGATPRPGGWASTDSDTEVEAAAAVAATTAARKTPKSHHQQGRTGGGGDGTSKEVEPVEKRGELKHRAVGGASGAVAAGASATAALAEASKAAVAPAAEATEPFPSLPLSPSGQKLSGSRSGVSTEDEWEKVSESEDK